LYQYLKQKGGCCCPNNGGGGGINAYTFSNGGPGISLVSSTSTAIDFKPVSLSAGANVTLTPIGTDILISATPGGGGVGGLGNMNYVGPGTTIGQHYIANDITGLNANNSALIEDADKVAFNGERILLTTPTSPFVTNDYAIKIDGFINNVGTQNGIWLDNTSSVGFDTTGIKMTNVGDNLSVGKSATGVDVSNVISGTGVNDTANAFNCADITATGFAFGYNAFRIFGTDFALGYVVRKVSSITGDSFGYFSLAIQSNNANAYGCFYKSISGGTGAVGSAVSDVNGPIATGYYADTIICSTTAAIGVDLITIQSLVGDAYGIRINFVSATDVVGDSYGYYANSVISNGNTFGCYYNVLNGGIKAVGSHVSGVNGPIATGYYAENILGSVTSAIGVDLLTITALVGVAYGIRINTVEATGGTGGDSFGYAVDTVLSNSGTAYGCFYKGISGMMAFGSYVSSIKGTTATGYHADNITATGTDAVGVDLLTITSLVGAAYGTRISNVVANGNSYGYLANVVNSNTANAFGCFFKGILAVSRATGFHVSSVNGSTATGYHADNITATGTDAVGVDLLTITSTGAVGAANGIRISSVVGNADTIGVSTHIVKSNNARAYGYFLKNVLSVTSDAIGYVSAGITGDSATGVLVESVNAAGVNAIGMDLLNIASPVGDAYGIRVDLVDAPTKTAYGCVLSNINGTREIGFYQKGKLNVGNIFDAHTDMGAFTVDIDQPALRVIGSILNKTQFFNTDGTITMNGGNTIICDGIIMTTINMPTTPPDGLTYTIWKTSTPILIINGNTNLINGIASQAVPIASLLAPQKVTITWSFALNNWLSKIS
jgi:energy-converting hydrogenase Eha subunit B